MKWNRPDGIVTRFVSRRWRLGFTVAFICLCGPQDALHAQLLVSYFGASEVGVYSNTGTFENYFCTASGTSPGAGEGLACSTTGGVPSLYMANNSSTILTATLTVPSNPYSYACSTSFTIAGAGTIAALAIDSTGKTLYAADYGADKIWPIIRARKSGGCSRPHLRRRSPSVRPPRTMLPTTRPSVPKPYTRHRFRPLRQTIKESRTSVPASLPMRLS